MIDECQFRDENVMGRSYDRLDVPQRQPATAQRIIAGYELDTVMAVESADRNLLFALIAMQSDLIDMRQFVDACTLWGSRKESSLAEVLIEQGWLDEEDRQHVDYLLKKRMKKAGGDVKKSLAGMPDDLKTALEGIDSGEIRQSLAGIESSERIATGPKLSTTHLSDDRITRCGLHSTGGIGQVWLAHDKVLAREVALKELKANQSESPVTRERFFREAQITAQLTHPGTVPVYDYVDDGTQSYYTMKFVQGATFTKQIQEYHRWRNDNASTGVTSRLIDLLHQFVSVCNTIAYAHSRQILHRDLKPENIVVGDFGEVIVLDWGLAKRMGDQDAEVPADDTPFAATIDIQEKPDSPGIAHTLQGEKLGTPAYMSPEQARGEVQLFDERTDVYGLASILYELLVGEPPFSGKSIVAMLENVIHDKPTAPRDRIDGIPRELEGICLQGLSKKRDDRQRSAAVIGNSVKTWIAERAERRRTEQERERFFNLSLDLLAIVSTTGNLTLTNPAWGSVLGWQSDDLQGMPVWELIAADDHARALKNHERILAGEALTSMEYRCARKDGAHCWILWNAKLIPGESSIYLVGRDITERKQAEQTFQGLLESAPDAMVVINQTGTIVLVNDQLERLFGYTRAELLGGPIELLVPEQLRTTHPHKVSKYMKDAHARPMGAGMELSGQRKDGTIFPVEISLGPVETEQGMLVSAAVRDVTASRKEEKKLQGILDAAPDAMVVADRDRRIILVNAQVTRIFGYAQDELIGQRIETLIPERFREGHPEKFDSYAGAPKFRPMGAGRELSGRRQDGSEFPVEISLSPLETEEGLLLISTIRDISERKRAAEET
ncbi:Serine/threonine-protein kinase PknD [Planctomycetes bacterium CA13]|uniref:Serine/threonine-protein kinase PknD n=1 Tax=Novipirellula herctigrandis TaxID=2527986 RepID=A0A5C5Z4C0_9BACT|nr:Serine/threonine-protein kinase PknD [Planctomycetes bacterium CA13]